MTDDEALDFLAKLLVEEFIEQIEREHKLKKKKENDESTDSTKSS